MFSQTQSADSLAGQTLSGDQESLLTLIILYTTCANCASLLIITPIIIQYLCKLAGFFFWYIS